MMCKPKDICHKSWKCCLWKCRIIKYKKRFHFLERGFLNFLAFLNFCFWIINHSCMVLVSQNLLAPFLKICMLWDVAHMLMAWNSSDTCNEVLSIFLFNGQLRYVISSSKLLVLSSFQLNYTKRLYILKKYIIQFNYYKIFYFLFYVIRI